MRCSICKKSSDEVELYKGLSDDGLVTVCKECSNREGITLLKKPTDDQLKRADERYTVRERMERLSGMRETTDISQEQINVQKNLARLRVPDKKEFTSEVVDNYFWNLKIARRRKKMTEMQLGSQVGVSAQVIQAIERGKLPRNYKEIFEKIELVLGIELLKNHEVPKPKIDEQKVLSDVRARMSGKPVSKDVVDEDYEAVKQHRDRKEQLSRISKGEADFSQRVNMDNVTINDLVEIKKSREKHGERLSRRTAASQNEDMVGDDLDLDLDEV